MKNWNGFNYSLNVFDINEFIVGEFESDNKEEILEIFNHLKSFTKAQLKEELFMLTKHEIEFKRMEIVDHENSTRHKDTILKCYTFNYIE